MRRKILVSLMATLVFAFAIGCDNSKPGGGAGGGGGSTHPPGPPPLRFTAIPDQNATMLKEEYDPVAAHLSEKLGIAVVYVPAKDYAASVEMFTSGDVQLAWFGGLTGVQARHRVKGARAIAQGEADPQYKSYFIAHKDTGLEKSEDFPKGIGEFTFTFGSESSTSGRLMPEHFIRKNTGKSPKELFKTAPTFSGAHDKTVELVQSGQVQVGAVNYKVYDKRVKAGKTDPDVCRIIWTTPFYADYNFTAHPDIDNTFGKGTIDRLQKELLAIEDEKLMEAFLRKDFIAAKNEDFDGIVSVAKELGFLD